MEFTTSNSPSEEIYLDMTTSELACKITEDKEFEESLLIANLDETVNRFNMWRHLLPRAEVFFAMKSCDNSVIRRVLATLGSGFDAASKREIEQLLEIGINPSKIIFTNTVKFRTHIKFAASVGVHLMTFDSVEELLKIHECDSEARLIVRILPPFEASPIPFGRRYGCNLEEVCHLVQKACDLNMIVEGISFHVGFTCKNSKCYVEAIKTARWVFDEVSKIGVKMSLLDIGGGYPGSRDSFNYFREIAEAIRETLDECFPPSSGVRVIAEPGQYMVAAAFNLYCKVILVKNEANLEDKIHSSETNIHINDGKHGTFLFNVYHHQDIKVLPLVNSNQKHLRLTRVLGPTCDPRDIIFDQVLFAVIKEGEWICFEGMGAYSISFPNHFNGFNPPVIKYIISSKTRHQLEKECKNRVFMETMKFCQL